MTESTDRELIDLAAKAEGRTIAWDARGAYTVVAGISGGDVWNPLESDADAFRLAVKLRLELGVSDEGDVFSAQCRRVLSFADADADHGDECALMRLAITRAAAEIGKAI